MKPANKTDSIALGIAQLLLYTFTIHILLSEAVFLLGGSMSVFHLPVSFLIGAAALRVFNPALSWKRLGLVCIATLGLFMAAVWASGQIYDFSFDGNSYHKLAVGLLKNHWNPLRQLPSEGVLGTLAGVEGTLWAECYSKGVWLLAAGIYALTGNIECGKAYTLLGMVCVFGIAYFCMKRRSGKTLYGVLFGAVTACEPVAVQQMASYYLDGYLHSMLCVLVLSFVALTAWEEEPVTRRLFQSTAACGMILCGTVKFNGLTYGGIVCVVYFLFYAWRQYRHGGTDSQKRIRRCFGGFVCLAAVTVLWGGADTYVMNTLRHRNPLYPLFGAGAVDIVSLNSAFGEVNHFQNLLISLFSKMENIVYSSTGYAPELKLPFTVDWERESAALAGIDVRISGYGIFFSGLLLLSLAVIGFKWYQVRKGKSERGAAMQLLFLLLLTAAGLSFGLTESWWARYAPYIYWIALIGFFFLLDGSEDTHRGVKCGGKLLLSGLFLVNSLLFTAELPNAFRNSAVVAQAFSALSGYERVKTCTTLFSGVYFNLEDRGVCYEIDSDTPAEKLPLAGIYGQVRIQPQG